LEFIPPKGGRHPEEITSIEKHSLSIFFFLFSENNTTFAARLNHGYEPQGKPRTKIRRKAAAIYPPTSSGLFDLQFLMRLRLSKIESHK
jgi:hypothetical protein